MAPFRNHIKRAVKAVGSQKKLADAMGCSQQQISYLLKGARNVSAEMAVSIERATAGAVTRHHLRPDIFGPVARQETAA